MFFIYKPNPNPSLKGREFWRNNSAIVCGRAAIYMFQSICFYLYFFGIHSVFLR